MARFLMLIALVIATSHTAGASDFEFHHENVMGTALELRVKADSRSVATLAELRVLGEIDRLSKIFSSYDPTSEFNRWTSSKAENRAVSRELFEVLEASDRWRIFSGGAFNPAAETFSRLWARCETLGRMPTEAQILNAKESIAGPSWRLNPLQKTAERLSESPLTLNAIAKGYIVEKACEAGMKGEVRGLLLNVGGDLRVAGEMTWTIGIVDPSHDSESSEPLVTVTVKNRAVATSGRRHRGYRINDRWYSHIIDPRTGFPADAVSSATVIALRSADADALATAFNVLAPEESVRLADSLPDVACMIVDSKGQAMKSRQWSDFERADQLAMVVDPPKQVDTKPSWGDTFEVAIDFEINRPEAEPGRYRRPYVAVWVENKDGFPVRNLALWVSQTGAGPFQWVPDLRRWFRGDKIRKKTDKREMVFVLSRPTRPPGKYTVIWDGLDDHDRPLPPGEYTIAIDAAREHGTYQGMRKTVTIKDNPFTEKLDGNVEIKSATLTYRKRTPTKSSEPEKTKAP